MICIFVITFFCLIATAHFRYLINVARNLHSLFTKKNESFVPSNDGQQIRISNAEGVVFSSSHRHQRLVWEEQCHGVLVGSGGHLVHRQPLDACDHLCHLHNACRLVAALHGVSNLKLVLLLHVLPVGLHVLEACVGRSNVAPRGVRLLL